MKPPEGGFVHKFLKEQILVTPSVVLKTELKVYQHFLTVYSLH